MRPTKAVKIKIAVSLLLMLVTGFMSIAGLFYFLSGESPFSREINFQKLYSATADKKSNIYRIDQSKKRITRTSPQGYVEFTADLNQSEKKNSAWFSRLEAGGDNSFYAVRTTKAGGTGYKEEILQYTGGTVPEKMKVLYTLQKNDQPEKIVELKFYNGSLYFIEETDTEQQDISVYKIPEGSTSASLVTNFQIPDQYGLSKITYDYSNENAHIFYFTTKKGEIFKYSNETSEFTKLYQDEKSNPVYIQLSSINNTRLVFADQFNRTIRLLDLGLFKNKGFLNITHTQELLSEKQFRKKLSTKAGQVKPFLITESMHVLNDDTIICDISDYVATLDIASPGEVNIIPQSALCKRADIAMKILRYFLPAAAFLLFSIMFLYLTYSCYIRRIILVKQFFWSSLFIAIIFTAAGAIFLMQIQSILTGEIQRQLESKVSIGVAGLDTNAFEKIKSTSDFESPEFCKLRDYIKLIQEEEIVPKASTEDTVQKEESGFLSSVKKRILRFLNPTITKMDYYSILYRADNYGDGNYLYNFCVTDDDHKSPFQPYFIPEEEDRRAYNDSIINDKIVFFDNQDDADGQYMLCLKRITLNGSNEYGLYEIGVDRGAYTACIREVSFKLKIILFTALIFIVGVIFFSTRRVLKPIKQLSTKLESFDGRTWGSGLSIHTGDELETLSNSFNKMNSTLQNYITDIENTRNAYARFVPRQISRYLHNRNIVDIKLKDHNTTSMCVMFSNICSFYTISKSMNARESFDFINEYLHTIGPVIPKCRGFINEFLGYGVMALFPENTQADNCLDTALLIQKNVREFNHTLSDRGQKTFEVSTAVHLCEKLIFGIVGFQGEVEDRLEAAAIDEGVVLAETLEGTAYKLGASVLATERVIKGLSDLSKYRYRYLGMFIFDNVNEPVNVYDVYQEDNEELQKLKEKTKERFETAVLLYQEKEFQKAKDIFIDIIGINSKDETAKIYFFLCDEYMKKLPRNWSKTVHL
ncbi:MAG TPA: adenylate/guanylate cyclase domain-containing protein [Ruminiclostridium sp.]|nr:adenylate/guanylate cyclase domain-containing protein [Ruminiclostridium sp.]